METVCISKQEYEGLLAQGEELDSLRKQVEELESLRKQMEEQIRMNEYLMEQYRIRQRKLFGRSSEKAYGQLSLFDEAEVTCDPEHREPEIETVKTYSRKKRTETKEKLPEDLPVRQVDYELSEENRICGQCGETMTEIGTKVRERIAIIPASAYILREVQHVYACGNCSRNGESTAFAHAELPKATIPGSIATAEAIAYIMTQKFVMGSPLYRQEQELERNGIPLSRQTMSNWMIKTAGAYLKPVYEQLIRRLLREDILHADETTVQVLHEDGKEAKSKSYMWLYRTGAGAKSHTVIYEYRPDRKSENPRRFLKEFHGYLHGDGYSGYHSLPDRITVVGCHAHARRKFDEALTALPPKAREGSIAEKGMQFYSRLFELEKKFADLSPEERYSARLKESRPVLDAFYAWVYSVNVSYKTAAGRAIQYMKDQRKYLENYLLDGRLEMTNNLAERSIKPFVTARKNFLFSNTASGAESSAVIFSLIETAKANGLVPYDYLRWVLRKAPQMDLKNNPEEAVQLLPEKYDPDEFKDY